MLDQTEEQPELRFHVSRHLTGASVAVQNRSATEEAPNDGDLTTLSVEGIRFSVILQEVGEEELRQVVVEVVEVGFPHDLQPDLHRQTILFLEHLFGEGFVKKVLDDLGGAWELDVAWPLWSSTAEQRLVFLTYLSEMILKEKKQPKLGELLSRLA